MRRVVLWVALVVVLVLAVPVGIAIVSGAVLLGPDSTGGSDTTADAPRQVTSDRLPDLTLEGFDGAPDVDLAELRGPLVINIWASWCKPCREEMPLIEEFHQQHGDQVDLLGIDYQDLQVDNAEQLVADTGVTYPLVTDPGGSINGQGAFPPLRGAPYWAFVDEDGTVTHVEAQVVESVDELVALAEEHLGVSL